MRQVLLVAVSVVSLSLLSGCTVVDPQYSHAMGGFLMPDGVKPVKDSTINVKKVSKPLSVES